jgi:ABC-type polar amino acid transport system ATPase subunit
MISDGVVKQMRPVRVGDVGVVFQRYPLFEDQSVINNLIEPAVRSGMQKEAAKAKALRYLDEFDLVPQGLAWPVQLSGGQRQRVANPAAVDARATLHYSGRAVFRDSIRSTSST